MARRARSSSKRKPSKKPIPSSKTIKKPIHTGLKEEQQQSEDSYACFKVGKELFAFALDDISEVLHVYNIEPVPHLPKTLLGIIKLRGESIPVIDLRHILNEDKMKTEQRPCIITKIDSSIIGYVVDTDVDIVTLDKDMIQSLPDCYTAEESRFLNGILHIKNEFIGILSPQGVAEVLAHWRKDEEI
jgi:purine-binding chemotaxis protein CheW